VGALRLCVSRLCANLTQRNSCLNHPIPIPLAGSQHVPVRDTRIAIRPNVNHAKDLPAVAQVVADAQVDDPLLGRHSPSVRRLPVRVERCDELHPLASGEVHKLELQ
jgi:hypothetical protein